MCSFVVTGWDCKYWDFYNYISGCILGSSNDDLLLAINYISGGILGSSNDDLLLAINYISDGILGSSNDDLLLAINYISDGILGSSNDDLLLAINCLDKLLKNTRKVPIQRVLGFVKRLSTVCLQLQPGAALAVLATLKRCIQVIVILAFNLLLLFVHSIVCQVAWHRFVPINTPVLQPM